MKHFGKIAILGALIVASSSFAFATPITPGQQNLTPSLTPAPNGTLFGSDSGSISAPTFTASWVESVYEGGTNSLCPTCLAFAFTFTNNGAADLEELAVSSFLNFTTDGDYVAGTGFAPTLLSETSDGTINYNFSNVTPGGSSDEVVIFTNATSDTSGYITLQDSTSGNAVDLAPAAVTPEPSSLMLLGTGLLTAAGIARRKFASKLV